MKKYLSVLAITALAANFAFAQGTVTFANGPTSTVKLGANPTDPAAVAMPTPGFAQLFFAPAGTALVAFDPANPSAFLTANPLWKFVGTAKGLAAAGRFSGGQLTLPGITPGANAEASVVAWNGNFTSFDAAVTGAAAIGASPKFTITTGGAGDPPSTPTSIVTAGYAGTIASPTTIVPEPSSMALAGLGAAALLIFRRRK